MWDEIEQARSLSLKEAERRNLVREDFSYWALMEKVSWRQKSREVCLKEGDKNTGFFHRMANSHWWKNFVKKLRIHGCWYKEEDGLKKGVVEAFQFLFSKLGGWLPSLWNLSFNQIGAEIAARLEESFFVEEIFEAVFGNSVGILLRTN